MFKFPPIEPAIQVVELPDQDLTITCTDAQSGFVQLAVGAEEEFAFYDYADNAHQQLILTGAHRVCVTQRIRVGEIDVLQIAAWYAESGTDYTGKWAQWNKVLCEQGLPGQITIETAGGEPWAYCAGTNTPRPSTFYLGLHASGIEPFYTTGIQPEATANWQLDVMNTVSLTIGSKCYRCLKVVIAYTQPGNTAFDHALLEYYIAENGRTVLARRYNSPAAENYTALAGAPVLEYHNLCWRRWYDTIPAHALIIGC